MEKRLALLFFILLLFELLPFCYMSFYVADRRFFAADVSNDLYHPSAYYISAVIAGALCVGVHTPRGLDSQDKTLHKPSGQLLSHMHRWQQSSCQSMGTIICLNPAQVSTL